MLLNISEHINECLMRATEARERAAETADPGRKADYSDMEQRWLRLVESYRFVEQANRFLDDATGPKMDRQK